MLAKLLQLPPSIMMRTERSFTTPFVWNKLCLWFCSAFVTCTLNTHHLLQPLILLGRHQNSHRLHSRVHRVVQRRLRHHPWHPQGKHEIVILNVAGAKAAVTLQESVMRTSLLQLLLPQRFMMSKPIKSDLDLLQELVLSY